MAPRGRPRGQSQLPAGGGGHLSPCGRRPCDLASAPPCFSFRLPLDKETRPRSVRHTGKKIKCRLKSQKVQRRVQWEVGHSPTYAGRVDRFLGPSGQTAAVCMGVHMCVIYFFLHSTRVAPRMIRCLRLQTLEAESLGRRPNSVTPKLCDLGQAIPPPCAPSLLIC